MSAEKYGHGTGEAATRHDITIPLAIQGPTRHSWLSQSRNRCLYHHVSPYIEDLLVTFDDDDRY